MKMAPPPLRLTLLSHALYSGLISVLGDLVKMALLFGRDPQSALYRTPAWRSRVSLPFSWPTRRFAKHPTLLYPRQPANRQITYPTRRLADDLTYLIYGTSPSDIV